MKNIFFLPALLASSLFALAEEQGAQDFSAIFPGMKGGYESVEAEVLKVYSATDQSAAFRAYVVKWKDQEIVVSDALGTTDKKAGEKITFLAQRIEMPLGERTIKLLQFMIMDYSGFMNPPKSAPSASPAGKSGP